MNNTADNFTAQLNGFDNAEQYAKTMNELLENLDTYTISKVANEEEYGFARRCQSVLTSLECYTFNNKVEGYDKQIYAQKDVVYKALKRYNARFLIKDKSVRSVARYLLWNYTFTNENIEKLIRYALENGVLRKEVNEQGVVSVYVVGLNYKVGDNVFAIDNQGRQYRKYLESSANQAFPVYLNDERRSKLPAELLNSIPKMENRYSVTYIGDGKGCARSIGLTRDEQHRVLELF